MSQPTPPPGTPVPEPVAGTAPLSEPTPEAAGTVPTPEPAPGMPTPEPAPGTPAPEPAGPDPVAAPPILDEGTYTAVREPRSDARLALDGAWHQISPKYVASQTVQNVIFEVILIAAGVFVSVISHQNWHWIGIGITGIVTLIAQIVLPRQARALGYMLRADDIVFRKGIVWQRMVAVPYGRMQLIDITQGPMDRAFGIARLKMVTAAATTGVEIPGLGRDAADTLRDTLIAVAETRRTGL